MLIEEIDKALSDQLNAPTNKPLAIAFSGGGDSTALLYGAINWARLRGLPPPQAFIVNHGLRQGSGDEAKLAAKRAQAMGVAAKVLHWRGPKPKTAIQEKARLARYTLLGEACRAHDCALLLLGHNRDDQAETVLMRAEKSSGWRGFAAMAGRTHAPLWPALYGIAVLRPLLDFSRAEIRAFNRDNNLSFIDDPANTNLAFGRIKARTKLGPYPEITDELVKTAHAAQILLGEERSRIAAFIETHIRIHNWGGLSTPRNNLSAKTPDIAALLKYLILAVSGEGTAPSAAKLKALANRLSASSFKAATLGGAHIVRKNETLFFVRDPGAVLGRHSTPAQKPQNLQSGRTQIWDGRFLLAGEMSGGKVVALGNYQKKLNAADKAALREIPPFARASLPVIIRAGKLSGYGLSMSPNEDILRYLADQRLCALLRQDDSRFKLIGA